MGFTNFTALIVRFVIFLALLGEMKACTEAVFKDSARGALTGVMPYSHFSKQLTR